MTPVQSTSIPRTTKTAPQAGPRTRSLGGCRTCRNRHTKCDETRPVCNVCRKLDLVCEGYEIRLTFDVRDDHGSRCRRPLFTEDMRQQMSEELMNSADPNHLNQMLLLMDEDCLEPEENTKDTFATQRGPFGAFRLVPVEACQPIIEEVGREILNISTVGKEPDYPETGLDMDWEEIFNGDPLMESLFWNIDAGVDIQANSFFSATLSHAQSYPEDVLGQGVRMGPFVSSPEMPSSMSVPQSQSLAPKDAPFLLSYYKNTVTSMFSPVLHEKTPWHIVHVPNAMESLARLSMGETPGNAPLCAFYAILATSAYVLRISTSQDSYEYWQQKAETFTLQAHNYLKLALQDASAVPKRVKYKDLLIALLCMHTVSAYQGSQERARSCLLDCESWIHSRGLPKTRKSRKVRLLHHCYVYQRIFHESTSVSSMLSSNENIEQTTPGTSISVTSNRSFRLCQWEGRLDQRMNELKDKTSGENDLHLELPGRWDPTMYPLIYGLPESFLFLLSQVTRLANEKDLSESGTDSVGITIKQFSTRARSLENYIRAWRPSPSPAPELGWDIETQPAKQELIQSMIWTFHKALLIFFYRRVYDMDATMLQDKVCQVRDGLVLCDRDDAPAARFAATFAWMAFVAGCEALDTDLQEWFSRWFDKSTEQTGLETFELAHRIARQVWERQRQPINNMSSSWPDLIREQGLSLFYA